MVLEAIANFFGKTKALAVWKEALSDSELTIHTFNNNIMNIYKTNFETNRARGQRLPF